MNEKECEIVIQVLTEIFIKSFFKKKKMDNFSFDEFIEGKIIIIYECEFFFVKFNLQK